MLEVGKIKVSGFKVHVATYRRIPAGLVGGYISVEYGPEWADLNKTAVFQGAVSRDVLNAGDKILIPHETVSSPGKELFVGIYGTNHNGTLVIPTLWASLGHIGAAANPSGDESTDPTLPIWAQLEHRISVLEKDGSGTSDGSGLSEAAASLLMKILQAALYGTDQSDNIKALATELGVELEDDPGTDEPDAPVGPDDPVKVKLAAPVIRLEQELPKLAAPVIRLETVNEEPIDPEEITPAILGAAVLGRTILGVYEASDDGGDGGDLPKLDTPVISLETETEEEPTLIKLDTPVISLITFKLDTPVIKLVEV